LINDTPNFISMEEHLLWELFKSGDEKALTTIFLNHYDDLFHYGNKLIADEEIVKDCIQNLFQKLWSRRDNLSEVKVIKPYLFKSLRRHIIDERNLSKKKRQLWASYEEDFDITFSHEDFLISQQISLEQGDRLAEAMNLLSKRQREALYLKFFDGLDYEKISEIMSLNLQSIRNLVYQAIKILKDHLIMNLMLLLQMCF
jgi:RNA polymerase sigma factor (sigma-70 family)